LPQAAQRRQLVPKAENAPSIGLRTLAGVTINGADLARLEPTRSDDRATLPFEKHSPRAQRYAFADGKLAASSSKPWAYVPAAAFGPVQL
jgi:hypothetical protein